MDLWVMLGIELVMEGGVFVRIFGVRLSWRASRGLPGSLDGWRKYEIMRRRVDVDDTGVLREKLRLICGVAFVNTVDRVLRLFALALYYWYFPSVERDLAHVLWATGCISALDITSVHTGLGATIGCPVRRCAISYMLTSNWVEKGYRDSKMMETISTSACGDRVGHGATAFLVMRFQS